MSATDEVVIKYGGFHHPKGFGLGPFGPLGSMLAGAAAIISLLLLPWLGTGVALLFGLVTGGLLLGASIKDRNKMSMIDKFSAKRNFKKADKNGSTLHIPGSLTHFGGHQLPGVLADSELAEWRDKNDNPFTVLRYPKDRNFVVPIACDPDGSSLVDPEDTVELIEKFGTWLASLSYEENIEQAAITIESSHDPGSSLTREMKDHTSTTASQLSRTWADDVQKSYPQGASRIRSTASLTYRRPKAIVGMDGKKIKTDDAMETIGQEISERLQDILDGLAETGAGHVHAMGVPELIETVRCAYNPADRKMYDELASQGLQPPVMLWDSVGAPSKAYWNHFLHGDATSITWEATGLISPQVLATALLPLLEPSSKVPVKRITILYRPMNPEHSAAIAESDHQAAEGRMRNTKKPTARQARAVTETDNTRHSEARGAGLMDFAILVTATVLDDGNSSIATARSVVERLGPTARLHLHAMNGSHDSAFAQGIAVLGLVTNKYLSIATSLQKGI